MAISKDSGSWGLPLGVSYCRIYLPNYLFVCCYLPIYHSTYQPTYLGPSQLSIFLFEACVFVCVAVCYVYMYTDTGGETDR